MDCIHHAVALELDPDAIGTRPREDDLKLYLWVPIGKKPVLVHHVDEVVARSPQVLRLITKWVDGGMSRGNNRNVLPKEPTFKAEPEPAIPSNVISVTAHWATRATSGTFQVSDERFRNSSGTSVLPSS